MKELRRKIFGIIFSIISSFIIITLIVINIGFYNKEYNNIKNNLFRMNEMSMKLRPSNDRFNDRIVLDYDFYTIILDNNNNINKIISHSDSIYSSHLVDYVYNILDNNSSNMKIGFLYVDNLAYKLNSHNFLTIVDTSDVRSRLLNNLTVSFFVLIFSLIVIYYISRKITCWITDPVMDSFNKQKEFIANASHELKTPLAVMMASADCLSYDKKNEKWVNNIKNETDRMSNLVNKLLRLSKTESEVDNNIATNNISKLLLKRVLAFDSVAFDNDITIDTNILEDVKIRCCDYDMNELFDIIIDNAIKHSDKFSTIKVNLYKDKKDIVIDIINKGNPIPKGEEERIFERFYRSDKSRERSSNRYGLGLSIARNTVNKYGGVISASSQDGYTTFRIVFKNII